MFSTITRLRSVFVGMTILAILISMPLDHGYAALVPTESSLAEVNANSVREHIMTLLAREEVRVALLQNGIDPAEAEARISSLTDEEVAQIGSKLDELAAGGDMGMSGAWVAVMVVLMVAIVAALIMFGVWTVNQIDRQR